MRVFYVKIKIMCVYNKLMYVSSWEKMYTRKPKVRVNTQSPFVQSQQARQALICHWVELISERKTVKEMHKDCDKTNQCKAMKIKYHDILGINCWVHLQRHLTSIN